MWTRVAARLRARPRAYAAGGIVVAAAVLAAAVWSGGRAEHAQLTFNAAQAALQVEPPPPPPAPADLQDRLETLAKAYREPVGVAVTDVEDRWTAQVAGDELYPQQSVSKLWVAISMLDAIDGGRFGLDQAVLMSPADRSVFFQPLAERIGSTGITVTLSDLLRRAITESDNSANDKLMRELGGAEAVTEILQRKGLSALRVGAYERDLQSKIAGLEWRPEYGLGWTFKAARAKLPDAVREQAEADYLADPLDGASPVAISHALAALHRGELLSPDSTTELLSLLQQTKTGPRRLKGGLPPGWRIGHKTGTGPDWRHGSVGINDVALITAPDGRTYAVAVMMRRTRTPVPGRLAFMQAVSRAVVAHWQAAQASPADQRIAE